VADDFLKLGYMQGRHSERSLNDLARDMDVKNRKDASVMENFGHQSFFKKAKSLATLFIISLVGHAILIFGSWALFGIGIFLFVPIIFGMVDAALSFCRKERITLKSLFKYFRGAGRSAALSHYAVLTSINVVLLGVFVLGLFEAAFHVLPGQWTEHPVGSVLIIMGIGFIYVIPQTYLSFASFIRIDTGAPTGAALKRSMAIVREKPFSYIALRWLFILRNPLIYGLMAMRVLYHLGITESPTQASGDPVMYSFFIWVGIMIVSGPFYDTMMAKAYLKSTRM
jgi:hypothetical protein